MRSELFYQQAFLRHAPQRYAVMLDPDTAERLDQKYTERRGIITDAMIRRQDAGAITLAAPAALNGQAHLLPLDVDAGGFLAICHLIAAAQAHGFWAFGQYCPRPGLDEQNQHGYVWLVFDDQADAAHLQLLGEQLISAIFHHHWKIESRAHAAVTRLPLGRHTHTGRFGELVFHDRTRNIDDDPAAALAELSHELHENPVSSLPTPPLPAPKPHQGWQEAAGNKPGITIDRYNQDHDLVALLEQYGAKPAKGSRRLMHCCGHEDRPRASLLLWEDRSGKLCCKCLSEHHACVLAGQMRDAFGVYCAMEGLTIEDALRRLNGKEASQ